MRRKESRAVGARGDRQQGQRALKYAKGPHGAPATRGDPTSQKFGGRCPGGVDGLAPRRARGLSGRLFPSGHGFCVSRLSAHAASGCFPRWPLLSRPTQPRTRGHDGARRRSAGRRRDYGKRDVLPKAEADLPDAAASHGGLRLPLWRDALLGTADPAAQSRGGGAQVPAAPGLTLCPIARYREGDARGQLRSALVLGLEK